jgi:glyoxylase-like metal-dependent hydrolase (beta-lactamase superfamily II)
MKISPIIVGRLDTNCFVVSDEETGEALIIDPGDEPEKICSYVDANSLKPKFIIFTHAHYDHVCAARELRERYNAGLVMHESEEKTYALTKKLCISWGYDEEDFPQPDLLVNEGDEIRIGDVSFTVIHTPGHTPGGICLHGDGVLFTGDTLFRGSAGRTDLPGGNRDQLTASLKKLMQLPLSTRVYCGHEKETSIELEMRSNPFMHSL